MDYLDMNNALYNRHIHQKKQHNAAILYAVIAVIEVLPILQQLEILNLTLKWS